MIKIKVYVVQKKAKAVLGKNLTNSATVYWVPLISKIEFSINMTIKTKPNK